MKKVLYSNATKLIAFILCTVFTAASVYLLSVSFVQNENVVYLFESSYEESHMANEALRSMLATIHNAASTVSDSDYEYGTTVYETEENTATPAPLTAEQQEEINRKRDEIMKRETEFLEESGWEYYIEYNGKTYFNTDDKSYESFEKDILAAGTKQIKTSTYGRYYTSFSNPGRVSHYSMVSSSDEFTACIRMSEKLATTNRTEWETAKAVGDAAAMKIIAMLISIIALVSYLFAVSGRHADDNEIHIMMIDRMFTEVTLVLIAAAVIIGALLDAAILDDVVFSQGIKAGNMLVFAVTLASAALILTLILSVIRNIKNHTFLTRSFIRRIALWVWKWFKKVNIIRPIIINVCAGIRALFGRRPGIIMAGLLLIYTLLAATNLFVAFIVFLIGCFLLSVRIRDFDNIKSGVDEFKKGNFTHKITDCKSEDYKMMSDDLNEIGTGMAAAVNERVKAERMKSELITNVSHDLKTPLTSIINYADLLSKEQLTPPEANDYVKIIRKKGERLKQLTNDLFEISKVQSGNVDFVIEDIDLCLLIEQEMAELNEAIRKSGLNFIVKSSDKEIIVKADGKKMSRVFENLFVNCVKYAMKNTRVYVEVTKTDKGAVAEVKNIAGYEMDFDENEIAERFVRGDSARTSEGSGLGLAIVKSYVEGCGGKLEIKKDGDLFKVIIIFEEK